MVEDNQIIVPFLKWAGGKRWLTKQYPGLFPKTFNSYVEPFLGGAAVFFFLRPTKAILGDCNSELVTTYEAIKKNWSEVSTLLQRHASRHSDDYFYEMRQSKPRKSASIAARMIYLNRTCWNGLYRVNLSGEFNVPRGTKNAVALPTDNFGAISALLKNTSLVNADFRETISRANKNDFLFVDPPYTVKHNLNGFVKYNEQIFQWSDQVALSESLRLASRRGVKVLVTNADHASIRELYKQDFYVYRITRNSVIAGDASSRGITTELAITNFRCETHGQAKRN